MLTVWGRPNSINVQIVMWTAAELGLQADRKDVGGAFGGLDTPDYLAMNPNGRIPTLQDGDLTIWESNACARYLAAKYGAGSLWPEDPAWRAKADMWMDWQKTSLAGPMTTLFWGLVRTPEAERDMDAIGGAAQTSKTLYAMLDEWLAGKDFILGEDLTIGDIPAGAMAYRFMELVEDRPSMPNLEAWYGRLTSRQAYRDHVMLPIT
jgi:glutathione S-transferase